MLLYKILVRSPTIWGEWVNAINYEYRLIFARKPPLTASAHDRLTTAVGCGRICSHIWSVRNTSVCSYVHRLSTNNIRKVIDKKNHD